MQGHWALDRIERKADEPIEPIERKSHLTGSRVYGKPHADSDIDIVMLVTNAEFKQLVMLADNTEAISIADYGSECHSLRFGKLNLICCTSQKYYDTWYKGTQELIDKKPIPRDYAVTTFKALRRKAGLEV